MNDPIHNRLFASMGTYPLLDNLLPPSYEEHTNIKNTLIRLENICACAIVKSKYNCQILSLTPNHLHKTLWKAFLRNEYYNNSKATNEYFSQIKLEELVYHWPYKEFNLKQVMPNLPKKIECFSPNLYNVIDHGPCSKNEEQLLRFYGNVAKSITFIFSNFFFHPLIYNNYPDCHSKYPHSFHEQHCHDIKIRKINLTGFLIFDISDYIEDPVNYKPIPKPNNAKLLEMILDARIPCGEYLEYAETNIYEIYHSHSKYYHSIRFRFEHVSLTGPYEKNIFKSILETVVSGGIKSLDLRLCPSGTEENRMIEEVLQNDEKQTSNIAALQLGFGWESLDILQSFRNLAHLSLWGNRLHGLLGALKNMHRGLVYLNLNSCELDNSDLDQLIGSCHQDSLLELILSFNQFSYDPNSDKCNLITLCRNLPNLLILNLSSLDLGSWNSAGIALLFNSWTKMPNIAHIDISDNNFSLQTMEEQMKKLQVIPSLRYVTLSFTDNIIDKDECQTFHAHINEDLNDIRKQLLYIDILHVETPDLMLFE